MRGRAMLLLLILIFCVRGVDSFVYSCEEVKTRLINSSFEKTTDYACVVPQEGFTNWDQLEKIRFENDAMSFKDYAQKNVCHGRVTLVKYKIVASAGLDLNCDQKFTLILTSQPPNYITPFKKADQHALRSIIVSFISPRSAMWIRKRSCTGEGNVTVWAGAGKGEDEERFLLRSWPCSSVPDWIFSFDNVITIGADPSVTFDLDTSSDLESTVTVLPGETISILSSGRSDDLQNLLNIGSRSAVMRIGDGTVLYDVYVNMQLTFDSRNDGYIILDKTYGPSHHDDQGGSDYTSSPDNNATDCFWKNHNDIWLDIVVILDTSEAMGKTALHDAGALIESFISDGFDDFLVTNPTSPFYTRVGVISMADTATVLYNLNMTKADKVQGKAAIKKGVLEIDVVAAFEAALNIFNDGLVSRPERANARQVVYYMTDSDPKNNLNGLNQFKASQGVIIVNNFLQEGEVELPGLKELASTGYYFSNDNYMLALQSFCKANCYCKPDKNAYGGSDPAIKASGGCYHPAPAGVPFNKAQKTCATQGGMLASIHDADKGRFVNQLMSKSKGDYYWMGKQKTEDGVWRWEDQSTDPYANWGPDEPSSAAVAKCAYVDMTTPRLTWGSGNCQMGLPYICQYTPCSVGYKDC